AGAEVQASIRLPRVQSQKPPETDPDGTEKTPLQREPSPIASSCPPGQPSARVIPENEDGLTLGPARSASEIRVPAFGIATPPVSSGSQPSAAPPASVRVRVPQTVERALNPSAITRESTPPSTIPSEIRVVLPAT